MALGVTGSRQFQHAFGRDGADRPGTAVDCGRLRLMEQKGRRPRAVAFITPGVPEGHVPGFGCRDVHVGSPRLEPGLQCRWPNGPMGT